MSDTILHMDFRPWRPSGYTDDLGIIADCNQWIFEQIQGWYVRINHNKFDEVTDWLTNNKIPHRILYADSPFKMDTDTIILFNEEDALLFKLSFG